ncbi:MAG: PH domain-containing protein [Gammaproteobacteria bacterium]|nr:PH domain-containing protein [Gammaproteobacteria bacterium]
MSDEARIAEVSIRLRNFLLPLIACIPMVFVDALAIGRSVLTDPNPWLVVSVSFYHLYLVYAFTSASVKSILGFFYVNRYRYRIDDEGIYVLSGVWMTSHQTLPRNRIQKVTLNQTYVQRLLGLTTLHAGAAGSGISIEHIPTSRAHHVREQIIEQLNRNRDVSADD